MAPSNSKRKRTKLPAGNRLSARNKRASGSKSVRSAASKSSKTIKSTKRTKAGKSASLLLRDLDPDVLAVLQQRAERSGRSLQQELHFALRRDAHRNFDEARAIAESWQRRLAGRDLPDSTELIREDRQR